MAPPEPLREPRTTTKGEWGNKKSYRTKCMHLCLNWLRIEYIYVYYVNDINVEIQGYKKMRHFVSKYLNNQMKTSTWSGKGGREGWKTSRSFIVVEYIGPWKRENISSFFNFKIRKHIDIYVKQDMNIKTLKHLHPSQNIRLRMIPIDPTIFFKYRTNTWL